MCCNLPQVMKYGCLAVQQQAVNFRQRPAAELLLRQPAYAQTLLGSRSLSTLLRCCLGQTTKVVVSKINRAYTPLPRYRCCLRRAQRRRGAAPQASAVSTILEPKEVFVVVQPGAPDILSRIDRAPHICRTPSRRRTVWQLYTIARETGDAG